MNITSYNNWFGVDVGWLSRDKDGFLALFITAGEGPIPLSIVQCTSMPVIQSEELLLEEASHCSFELFSNAPDPTSFSEIAKRGVFVFDWDDVHRSNKNKLGKYVLVASPVKPKPVVDFPKIISEIAELSPLEDEIFKSSNGIDPRIYYPCMGGPINKDNKLDRT